MADSLSRTIAEMYVGACDGTEASPLHGSAKGVRFPVTPLAVPGSWERRTVDAAHAACSLQTSVVLLFARVADGS